ncbi:MAG: nitroreductase family deazaflavin-dependent oxidoreductase [SAR202 cluster bacterium]|nr:nitroreductase [Chloroflexota bacterium]MQG22496.1 nitroreductase family deazaflavin-dependent oxidoreductase [SAR202 cluster bacterium]
MLVKRSSMFRFQLIKWFSSFHKYVLIKSNGRLMHNLLGHNMLLLENVGRKTSQIHQTPLLYIKSSESTFLTVGSFGGHPKHPAWFLNIKDIKKTNLIVKGKKLSVDIHILSGNEKKEAWRKLVLEYPGFSRYQEKTSRPIPVIEFTVSND